jgi:hypothetical protein
VEPFLYECSRSPLIGEAKVVGSRLDGTLFLEGVLQKADTLNQNGRIYPHDILSREVNNYQRYIIENRATGALDHPDTSVVMCQDVSHIVREARLDGKVVRGRIEVLPTPKGRIVSTLVECNVRLGISSRGVGSTEKDGDYQVVQDDFMLICWDIVSEPSTPGAFIEPVSEAYSPMGKSLSQVELEALGEVREAPAPRSSVDVCLDDVLQLTRKRNR